MLDKIDKNGTQFDETFRSHVDKDIKCLKKLGELEYNFENMLQDIDTDRKDDTEWLNDMIQHTINDEKIVYQKDEATRKLLISQINFLKVRIKNEVDSRKLADEDIKSALDKYKEMIEEKIQMKRNDIKKRE